MFGVTIKMNLSSQIFRQIWVEENNAILKSYELIDLRGTPPVSPGDMYISVWKINGFLLDLVFSEVTQVCGFWRWGVEMAHEQFTNTTNLFWARKPLNMEFESWLSQDSTSDSRKLCCAYSEAQNPGIPVQGAFPWALWTCDFFWRCTDKVAIPLEPWHIALGIPDHLVPTVGVEPLQKWMDIVWV